jgi:hypothetical protein
MADFADAHLDDCTNHLFIFLLRVLDVELHDFEQSFEGLSLFVEEERHNFEQLLNILRDFLSLFDECSRSGGRSTSAA